MGLNHQLASLSCALAEAHHLGRTLVLPPSMCLFGLHTERWSGSDAPGGRCVPMGDLFDLELLSRLVPVVLGPIENRTSPQQLRGAVDVRRGLKSAEVASQHPCARAPVVRRRVDNFWFTMCSKRIADSDSIMGALHAALGSPPSAKRREPGTVGVPSLDPSAGSRTPPPPPLPRPLNVLLRSGLFYSQRIKRAVRAVQRSIGGASGRWDPADSDSLRALSRERGARLSSPSPRITPLPRDGEQTLCSLAPALSSRAPAPPPLPAPPHHCPHVHVEAGSLTPLV